MSKLTSRQKSLLFWVVLFVVLGIIATATVFYRMSSDSTL